jgi:hypothetical protein
MRTAINLSRQPFVNHRLLWLGVIATSLLTIFLMLWISNETRRVENETAQTKQRIEDQKLAFRQAEEERAQREQAEHAVVITEQDSYQLAAARLLIQKRQLSWTRILSDLEKYVPENTRVTGIKVDEILDADRGLIARIEVKAIGKTSAELTAMMESFGKSKGLFEVGEVTQEAATDTSEVPFNINLTYQPWRGEQQ